MARIIFMGTPQFAVETLSKIIKSGHKISAVITVPDKPAGRGLKMLSSAVCLYAKKNNLQLYQPENLDNPEFIQTISELEPDIITVVAFRKIPKSLWAIPKFGTFNVHASLLPQYRGAAPMNHAIINGETKTGITTFLINDNIDTGNIICQQEVEIKSTDTVEDLHDKMMNVGANLAVKTIDKLISGNYSTINQNDLLEKYAILHKAPKITRKFCEINWNDNTINIYNKIRGLSPAPCAYTDLTTSQGKILNIKIFKTDYEICCHNKKYGTMVTDNRKYLGITTKDGIVYLKELQLSGKKRMNIENFLRGIKL